MIFENYLIITILKFNKLYVIIGLHGSDNTRGCEDGMKTETITECPFGHPGLLVKHIYFEGETEKTVHICEDCKELLDRKFGTPCIDPWSTQREYLNICYDALDTFNKARDRVDSLLPEKRGRKPKDGRTIIFEDLGKLKKHIRVNKESLGEDKTVALLRKVLEVEEALNGQ